jgi:hypothetical protein
MATLATPRPVCAPLQFRAPVCDLGAMSRPPRPGLIFTAPELPIAFVQIGKTASTAIKQAMWRAVARARGDADLAEDWPRLGRLAPEDRAAELAKETFTVLRDPLERFWSAYHSKMGGRDVVISAKLAARYGVAEDVGLDQLARLIAEDPEGVGDRHFAPQAALLSGLRIDRWFRYERLDEVDAYLRDRIDEPLALANVNPDKPGMAMAPETETLLRRYYSDDYALLAGVRA